MSRIKPWALTLMFVMLLIAADWMAVTLSGYRFEP